MMSTIINDEVLKALTEKIQRQNRFITELEDELQRARQASYIYDA